MVFFIGKFYYFKYSENSTIDIKSITNNFIAIRTVTTIILNKLF